MYLKKDSETLKGMIDSSKSSERERSYFGLWSKILKDISLRILDTEKEIEGLQSVIKALEDERGKEISSIEGAYEQLIESKMKLLNNMDMERELEVKKMREEAKGLSNRAMDLRRQISNIDSHVKSSVEQVEQLPLQEFKNDRPKLLCMPFYFVCYEDIKGGKRYKTYPPSLVQFSSTFPPLKWMHSISAQPLRPYSGQLMDIFEVRFIEHLKADPVLEGEIYKKGKKLDMLTSHETKKQISNSIDTLVKLGWMTQGQASALRRNLK
jgi:hypothetical protein